ncbi:MAG: hypothetical protein COZ37_07010 [bacterium (Candidatus Ratteibacteria) CG_4_10_14_3_um_filter_41_18]|uniref:Type II secretion system protein GspF domain-containing protein n=3 Tax=Candidatus Ratteibacteria TaxID=2979319 RepID=A0A2M7E7E3_9BACT|nr:MAG: hypothetical protein AUJ76_02465 [Candidatus Omnitrophica bacterium CG1_02_41_171]PIV63660.1 MAG: hypothetical protein COS11_06280 [bacterium (Candidatus Ratteibacteria) CG01_land_8_20_14_3_00_40_19]PIW74297.1 MAG: hypothetical protein CO004_01410 [bacterium (Candidatus Ratteibacteria) CG_4_8_14_3_um_filter_41_36]PIX76602.1 MAG: hypothetical protein COZ37_07010 [bacterium (Candidatus Ratteibacteria) CG_4_10_14_3_um_filter_41_18]PJA61394.1 MAG: hypothetical protein CO162_06545 [bacterium
MATFVYQALNRKGQRLTGSIDALDERESRLFLRKRSLYPIQIGQKAKISYGVSRRRVKEEELVALFREISTLVSAHLPLTEALGVLASSLKNEYLKKVILEIKEQVSEGRSLSAALENYQGTLFPPMLIHMIKASEKSGSLPLILSRFADFKEKSLFIKSKIFSILTYPIIMIIVGFVVLSFLFTFVLPTITKIFTENNLHLPLFTSILLKTTNFLKGSWFLILFFLVVLVFAFRRYIKTPSGSLRFDRFKLKIPFFSGILRKSDVANFSRTLSTLLSGGVDLLTSFGILKGIVRSKLFAKSIEVAKIDLGKGIPMSNALDKEDFFPGPAISLIAAGEKSGQIEIVLNKIAELYEGEVEAKTMRFISLLEPMMILLMGLVVGLLVLSILLPIFEISQTIH